MGVRVGKEVTTRGAKGNVRSRQKGGVWYVNKRFRGQRIRESTGSSDLTEAEKYLVHRLEQIRQAEVYGVRPKRTWRQAATKYLQEATKATLGEDARQLKYLDPYIGDLPLEAVHMGSLQQFIKERKFQRGEEAERGIRDVRKRTINSALQTVRHILNLAASEWLDERGQTWLAHAPKIKLLRENDKKEPYPLSPQEQLRLFSELPEYLAKMALFKVNTGCRDQEVCNLRWNGKLGFPN